jgi:chromosome partitioning protein
MDCPPSLGLVTLNALTACDSLLIPLQCEYYALEGLSSLLSTVSLVRDNLNGALAIDGLILTMFDGRNTLCRQVADDVKTHFPDKVFDAVVPRNVRLSESPSHGLPALLYDPSSKGAQAYAAIAKELIKRLEGSAEAAAETPSTPAAPAPSIDTTDATVAEAYPQSSPAPLEASTETSTETGTAVAAAAAGNATGNVNTEK